MELTVDKDLDAHTLTVVATFDHPVEKVWELYADPRKLERWWGPPTHPATMLEHDFVPGGSVHYVMTAPDGEQFHGRWDVLEVEPRHRFSVVDAFADVDGVAVPEMPLTRMEFSFEPTATGTRMVTVSRYDSLEALQQVLDMGVEEGLRGAMSQMDAVLEEG
ncbi:SRPBCC domain-containing protein [Homoserinibacter sp. GY 40078]|uniref:SRPBCC family protein n=1 Tax=Homoserinibacter sp. GY 40078 TaxID=2603275 RepID=UPI0011C86DB2|nr:SRPBCC domain-containing protein [Homoserinibacter sp. GY 40078]TXK16391.1 SRPBCC domain-containing protein [Homoserinibacter sp. GY 40078]